MKPFKEKIIYKDSLTNDIVQIEHLLTTTAENYFAKKRFTKSPRENAPNSIRQTTEFSVLCPSTSVYMTLDIH